ncbi:MAG: c-type cytochrome, partial [Thermoanaerobaculia bacterium]
MAVPPDKRPDRHYHFGRANMVFAWSALALLVVTIWMIAADYAKPWKRLQARFRDLERGSVEGEMAQEQQRLDPQQVAAAQAAVDAAAQALAGEQSEIASLEDDFVALDKKIYAADAAARGTKSLLDTARFQYGEALHEGEGGEEGREVAELRERWIEQRRAVEELTRLRDDVAAQLAARRSGQVDAEKNLAALESRLEALRQRDEKLAKGFDFFALNAPLTDFVEPDLKVEQVMLPGLFLDINFTDVQRVDRCMTCHVAAGRAGFDGDGWEHPFRSHPRLDLFVGAASPHPYNRFGCSSCHGGLDRATDFARAGHSPASEEQQADWIARWGWEPQKYLDTPISPAPFSEAGCVSCHAGELWTPGSQTLEVGRELITRMGCYGCHLIDAPAFQGLPKPGPSLARVASKTNPGWAYKWISAPRDFHPTTWMPHFFFEENARLPENVARQEAEIAAIVAYLWGNSERRDYPDPPAGDAARGRELVETVGCMGCHVIDADAERDDFFPLVNRLNGPNLVRTGSKVDPGWLYAWVRNPKQYNPDTRMPSLRLSEEEAADVVAYLAGQRDGAWEHLAAPAADRSASDALLLEYLQGTLGLAGGTDRLEEMSAAERDLELGRQSIQKYGCYGCHEIGGFEDAKPIGVELTEEGSKPVHQFDFGFVHEVPHTRHDWLEAKLRTPRVWDEGKEQVKEYGELLRMPNFGMSEREAEAVVVNLLGLTKESVVASRKAGQSARSAALAAGRRIVTYYNCQGCHLIEGRGQAIASALPDRGMLPPNLAAQGARTQSEWLFQFLHDPSRVTLRPWLAARMPTFGFEDREINSLVGYFAARDGYP